MNTPDNPKLDQKVQISFLASFNEIAVIVGALEARDRLMGISENTSSELTVMFATMLKELEKYWEEKANEVERTYPEHTSRDLSRLNSAGEPRS